MFEYFPDNYAWSLSVAGSIAMGGQISEIDAACRPLRGLSGAAATEAWFQNWTKLGEHLDWLCEQDLVAGREFSAGEKALRACNYYLFAERNMPFVDPRRRSVYSRALGAFARGVKLRGDSVERLEIAYEGKKLSGWLHLSASPAPQPCVLFYNGFDSVKEMHYLMFARVAAARGIAVLFVDQEGTGEALHLQKLPKRHDTEVSAGLFVDALQAHGKIDPERIGIVGLSAGGYCAPRAATFEQRLQCCACIGALFRIEPRLQDMLRGRGGALSEGLSNMVEHLKNVMGKDDLEEALAEFSKRDLTDVIGKLKCPLLVVHGENDRQVPLVHAEQTVKGATNAKSAELRVFTLREGGAEHCGVDIISMQGEYVFDWLAQRLGGRVASAH